jgi:polar amino acid transport system permease protein
MPRWSALVLMVLVLSLLGQLLSFFPEPIGSNAAVSPMARSPRCT